MKTFYHAFIFLCTLALTILHIDSNAQVNNCPGCVPDVSCTISPAYPSLCPKKLPDGKVGLAYDQTLSSYMPAYFIDPGTGINLTLLEIEILNIVNLPYGLSWTSNIYPNKVYYPSSNPPTTEHGCVRICGTPLLTSSDSIKVDFRVKVDAGIGGIVTQNKSFKIAINILAGSSGNSGFSVTNGTGCAPITSSFQTNFPSNGNPSYSYAWNFGNGLTSPVENPPAQTYSTAGTYQVTLSTTIDTFPYMLKSVEILGSDCTDFLSDPDFYAIVKQGNTEVLNTHKAPYSASIDQIPPVQLNFNPIRLKNATYKLQIWDEDGGFGGADDSCGQVTFNGFNAGVFTQTTGALIIKYEISHQKLIFYDTVKITVYPNPSVPVIQPSPNDSVCVNDSILLSAPQASSYQWYKDTVQIVNAGQQNYTAGSNGNYALKITNSYGCSAKSAPVKLTFVPNPPKPALWTFNGTLNTNLSGFILQWYWEGQALTGANKMTYIPVLSGNYYVKASNVFGCSTHSDSVFITCPIASPIVVNPNDTACVNDTIILLASGGGSYQWYKDTIIISGANSVKYGSIQSGMYQYKVTNSFGCAVKSAPVQIQFMPNPVKPLILVSGNQLSTVSAGNTLQWYFHGQAIQGANQSNYLTKGSGYYAVEAENAAGCKTKSDSIFVNYIGIQENETRLKDLNIYPNPSKGIIQIDFTGEETAQYTFQLLDLLGRTLQEETANILSGKKFEKKMDISIYGSGMYMLMIQSPNHQSVSKIIIE